MHPDWVPVFLHPFILGPLSVSWADGRAGEFGWGPAEASYHAWNSAALRLTTDTKPVPWEDRKWHHSLLPILAHGPSPHSLQKSLKPLSWSRPFIPLLPANLSHCLPSSALTCQEPPYPLTASSSLHPASTLSLSPETLPSPPPVTFLSHCPPCPISVCPQDSTH